MMPHVEQPNWPIDLMMKIQNHILILLVACILGTGVTVWAIDPPVTVAEYEASLARQEAYRQNNRGASSSNPRHGRTYPPVVLAKHNLQRAMDPDLTAEERTASLELAIYLDAPTSEAMAILAMIMADPETPAQLQQRILEHLLDNEYGDLTQFVVASLSQPEISESMKRTLLIWVQNNADETLLGDIVKAWADQPAGGSNEDLYRSLTELAAGSTSWSQVLWDGLTRPSFKAKGSAFEILRTRLTADQFAQQLRLQEQAHMSIATLQAFLRGFNYIPNDRDEMLQAVYLYASEKDLINSAARVYRSWHTADNYAFNIRDLHLMGQLGLDANAFTYTRAQLRADLAGTMADNEHVPQYSGGEGEIDYDARFHVVDSGLTMADLWNIWLLEDYLSQEQTKRQILLLADEDLQNTATPFGGLLFLEEAKVEGRQYAAKAGANEASDQRYVASDRLKADARDALCRFVCHFDAMDNSRRVGPTPGELDDAAEGNYYGLSITRLSKSSFTAHYYNPDGEVVSLGVFGLGDE